MKATIILSTFNGARYLREQMDSILAQTYQDWILLVRDDGSTDDSIAIVDSYIVAHPDKIRRIESEGNVGVIRSFELLMKEVSTDYIFFCDQDDIWLPHKVEVSMGRMQEEEIKHPSSPVVVFSDLKVVDHERKVIADSFWKYSKINPELLKTFDYLSVHSVTAGCTMLINRAAKECSLPFIPEVRMHDSWVVLCVAKRGGCLSSIAEPTMLYRQHSGNVVGAIDENSAYWGSRLRGLSRVFENNKAQWRMVHALGFRSVIKFISLKILYHIKYKLA